jgi:Na+-driven multidrug efflux pump
MTEIKLFLFVLSIMYVLRFIIEFVIKLTQDNPEPLVMSKLEQTLQIISLSYIITYILI